MAHWKTTWCHICASSFTITAAFFAPYPRYSPVSICSLSRTKDKSAGQNYLPYQWSKQQTKPFSKCLTNAKLLLKYLYLPYQLLIHLPWWFLVDSFSGSFLLNSNFAACSGSDGTLWLSLHKKVLSNLVFSQRTLYALWRNFLAWSILFSKTFEYLWYQSIQIAQYCLLYLYSACEKGKGVMCNLEQSHIFWGRIVRWFVHGSATHPRICRYGSFASTGAVVKKKDTELRTPWKRRRGRIFFARRWGMM